MAGYSGYSKSHNAIEAEEEGRLPISRAVKVVAKATGLSQAEARALLERRHGGEFHHTSKMYNRTNYYDTVEAIEYIRLSRIAAALPAGWRAPLDAARKTVEGDTRTFQQRHDEIGLIDAAQAAALGIDVEEMTDVYYTVEK